MKILAPLRHPDEVEPLAEAGADEFYCGATPPGWAERFGTRWAHRRDPRSSDAPSLDELVGRAGPRPVYLTLNAPAYPTDAVDLLVAFGRRALDLGFAALVVADLELVLAFAEAGLAGRVHVSSLATCTNAGTAAFLGGLGVARVVLPRHLTLGEIEAIAASGVELEVFGLNDGCVFEEGLCATTHGLGPFCLADGPGTEGAPAEALDRYAFWKWTLNNCGCRTSQGYPLGPCGLCALPRLLALGVASLKIVGREASLERKRASVALAAGALRLAEAGGGPEALRERVGRLRGARGLCEGARLCYYPDVWEGTAPGQAAEAARC